MLASEGCDRVHQKRKKDANELQYDFKPNLKPEIESHLNVDVLMKRKGKQFIDPGRGRGSKRVR